jgi:hypothetical protein
MFPFVCVVLEDCPLAGDGGKRRAEGHVLSQGQVTVTYVYAACENIRHVS